MSFPDLTAREHEVAARECDAIADYLEKLAGFADGPIGPNLAMQHRVSAVAVRARAARHRERATSQAIVTAAMVDAYESPEARWLRESGDQRCGWALPYHEVFVPDGERSAASRGMDA